MKSVAISSCGIINFLHNVSFHTLSFLMGIVYKVMSAFNNKCWYYP